MGILNNIKIDHINQSTHRCTFHVLVAVAEAIVNARVVAAVEDPISTYTTIAILYEKMNSVDLASLRLFCLPFDTQVKINLMN